MNIRDADFFRSFLRAADDGWKQGWHEANGGNLSFRLRREDLRSFETELRPGEWAPLGISVPELAGETLLVTGAGRCFRDIAVRPQECLCIIELDEHGERMRPLWGLTAGGRPTSELPTHLVTHAVKTSVRGGTQRAVYHAHPANLIALTFVLPLSDEVFTRELWEMFPECPLVFPDGVGVVPWMVPGSRSVAAYTGELMKKYSLVIWAHHGVFCTGAGPDEAFGLMHTAEKSAEVLVKVLSMGPGKRQTVTAGQLRQLAGECGADLPERFLYEKD